MTLEKIRAALPTHIMLTPGVHRWREGDEYWSKYESEWVKAVHMSTKILCEMGTLISFRAVRRPIPPHILDNQAFWLRFGDTVPGKRVGTKQEHDECAFLRPDGNGGAAFYLQSTAGRLYDKWLLEQMEDV